jgi:copper(I)-binding protein
MNKRDQDGYKYQSMLFMGIMGYLFLGSIYNPTYADCSSCPEHTQKSETAEDVSWVRPAKKGQNSAAYLSSVVKGLPRSDRLLQVKSPIARSVELHDHIHENGIAKMRPVKSIEINEGRSDMKAGGKHIMLLGLNRHLNPGENLRLTLVFEMAGEKEIEFVVQG